MDSIPPSAHVTYSRQYRRCGKANCASCNEGPGHGPYWFAMWRESGRRHRRYLGVNPPRVSALAQPTVAASRGGLPVAARPTAAPALRVLTLGAFAVHFDGRPIPPGDWRGRKAGSLFKLLLGAPGFALPREQAEEQLWPEAAAETARQNLHNALYAMRRLLGTSGRSVVRVEGDVLRLVTPSGPDWLDALAFESSARAALAGQDPRGCRRALALYLGDYLPDDPYEEWALGRREVLRALRLSLLLHLADLAGAQGDLAEAEQCLRTALAQDLCHEEATGRLMALLEASGRRAEGLRAYDDLATALARDLGVIPSRDLVTLRGHLLAQESTPIAASQPPQGAVPTRRTNLPVALTSFIGRVREQQDIRRLVSETRLLTLTGAGGCGKTRLALQVADSLVDAFPDGLWLVQLAATANSGDDAAPVARAVASVLGVQEDSGRPLSATLASFLAPRATLLLLDNCEHMLGSCAALTVDLLTSCPHLRIVTTSRERLGVPGEFLYHVASLALPPVKAPPGTLATYEAVALFLDRARFSAPADLSAPAVTLVVAQICRRLDGIPLAIELAAARSGMLSLQTLAARLDDCFGVLTGGPRTALPRQRTLRATLDWSYALLSEPERVVLRRLSAFAGGWTIEAARAVCDEAALGSAAHDQPSSQDTLLDCLSSLVGKSLVQLDGYTGVARYRFLEPVRQYAAEALRAAGEASPVRDRHLAWCVDRLARAVPALWDGPQQEAWMARIEREHDNCRAALRWSVERECIESGLRLACALRRFWDVRGYRREGLEWLETLLQIDRGEPATAATRATALLDSATLAYGLNDYRLATERAERGLALCRELGDREGMADALNVLGMIASDKEDLDTAFTHYANALAIYQLLDKKRRITAMQCNLANIAYFRGEYGRAVEMYQEVRDFFLALGDFVALAVTLSNMGAALRELGDLDRATATLEQSAAYARQAGATNELANALNNLGDVALRRGECALSIQLMRQSADLFMQCGDRRSTLVSLVVISEALVAMGQAERAACLCAAISAHCQVLDIRAVGSEWAGLTRSAEAALASLGEARYARAQNRGRLLTLEQAVALGQEPE